ncbi:MAG: alpha/beta fold hydrolase [Candidatus Riflebacteria bacterium]|nr:alpha/beta fold hydrolase [Candidatus Riflebacteria bacterium]
MLRKPSTFILICCTVIAGIWSIFRHIAQMIVRRPIVETFFLPLPKADFEFTSSNPQGNEIAAWWYQGRPGAGAVLLCHGHGSRHEKMIKIFDFLRNAGYSVFLLDFRAHGNSGGDYTSIGLHEWEDIAAVIGEAERRHILQPETRLAAYGCSMGAAALANGADRLPRINAFILESMYSDFRKVAVNYFNAVARIPDCFLIDLVLHMAMHESGYSYYQSRPCESVRQIFPRPLLLIQDNQDNRVFAEDFARITQNASWAKISTFEQAPHVGALRLEPARFEREFLDFIASAGISVA